MKHKPAHTEPDLRGDLALSRMAKKRRRQCNVMVLCFPIFSCIPALESVEGGAWIRLFLSIVVPTENDYNSNITLISIYGY